MAVVLAEEAGRPGDDADAFVAAGLITAAWSIAFVRAHGELSKTGDPEPAKQIFLTIVDRGVAGTHAALEGTPFGNAG